MKPGDTIIDSQGRNWTILEHLGRGLWGQSALARGSDGREVVIKTALRATDFPADIPLPEGVDEHCNRCLREQKTLLESTKYPFLPKFEGVATLSDGRNAILMTRYKSMPPNTGDLPIVELLERLLLVGRALKKHGRTHGNLRPSNILWNERNEPVLTDFMTPSANKMRQLLKTFGTKRDGELPPEEQAYPTPVWDTWALCRLLYASLTANSVLPDGDLPSNGVSKLQLATLKDQTVARLKREGTNLRFIGRITEKMAALLNRGLSAEAAPSPPYRFNEMAGLCDRLGEIHHLTNPQVVSVGKILFTTPTLDNVFTGTSPVGFAVSIGCTKGITSHDDIVCGLQLVDRDAEGAGRVQLDDVQYEASVHASGRLRFRFHLPTVLPGRYSIRVAFSIKGSGHEPHLSTGTFELRPQPGYVPPAEPAPVDATLQFPKTSERPKLRFDIEAASSLFTDPGNPTIAPSDDGFESAGFASSPSTSPESFYSSPGTDPETGGELIEGFFPKPIAPSQADSMPPSASPVQARPAPATMPPYSTEEEPVSHYEPQRMVATATPSVAPPVEQITPQVHSSAQTESPLPSAPSGFFPPAQAFQAFAPGQDPVVPSAPVPSTARQEPSIGHIGGVQQASQQSNVGGGGWFESSGSQNFLLEHSSHLEAALPGVNGIAEDLPTCTETAEFRPNAFQQYVKKAVRIAQDDLYVATILAATVCMSGILCLTLLLKSCG
jgi:hypothetical protein